MSHAPFRWLFTVLAAVNTLRAGTLLKPDDIESKMMPETDAPAEEAPVAEAEAAAEPAAEAPAEAAAEVPAEANEQNAFRITEAQQ